MSLHDRIPPDAAEYVTYRERFNNWGRWTTYELGTLNHITPEVRRAATASVVDGVTVSLGRRIDTHPSAFNPFPAQHLRAMPKAGGIEDWLGLYIHGFSQTHLDALCHTGSLEDGKLFNGVVGDRFDGGADALGIQRFRDGIVTRGVLYDIPALRGTEYVAPGEPVHGWDLVDAAERQGVKPRAGDAVVVRCGRDALAAAVGPPTGTVDEHGAGLPAGLHASVAEFLYETDASMLVWDLLDAPTVDQGIPNTYPIETAIHLHQLLIPYMGMPLLDNIDADRLAAECARRQRWDFVLAVAPLVIEGGTGSPVNPIAVL